MIKKSLVVLALGSCCLAALAAHGDEKTGILVDVRCSKNLLESPDLIGDHSVSCSLECRESGFGLISKGKFYRFDDYGNQQALLLLRTTQKTSNLKVRVEAHFEDDLAKLSSIETIQ